MSIDQDLGFRLPEVALETRTQADTQQACLRTRRALERIVHDTVALEDNPLTFPEVRSLMNGITVKGRAVHDTRQALNQAESWRAMLDEVETGRFVPLRSGLQSALRLHALVSNDEALEWGKLRTGSVGIAGTDHQPPNADDLDAIYQRGAHALRRIRNTHMRAIASFLFTARNQLFWDGNKRTGRLMMNGELLAEGHSAITVPAKNRHEFDATMIAFYETGNASEMIEFLSRCPLDRGLTTGQLRPPSGGRGQRRRQPTTAPRHHAASQGGVARPPPPGNHPDTARRGHTSPSATHQRGARTRADAATRRRPPAGLAHATDSLTHQLVKQTPPQHDPQPAPRPWARRPPAGARLPESGSTIEPLDNAMVDPARTR